MAQNADDTTTAADDSARVTEEDLRKDKYGDGEVDTTGDESEEDESLDTDESDEGTEETGEDEGKTDVTTEDETSKETDKTESADDDSEYVKEFPNIKGDTLVDYARNLESTIRESNNEGKRLADENKSLRDQLAVKDTAADKPKDKVTTTEVDPLNPVSMYAKQKMDEEIQTAYTEFSKHYPQVSDATAYAKFVDTVKEVSTTIMNTQQRLASPKELYAKAAAILEWKPEDVVDGSDKLKVALKNKAAVSTASSSTPKKSPKSRLSEAVIAGNMRMFPGKSRQQIIEELEPYVPN